MTGDYPKYKSHGAILTISIGPCFFSFFCADVLRLRSGVIFLSNSAERVEKSVLA